MPVVVIKSCISSTLTNTCGWWLRVCVCVLGGQFWFLLLGCTWVVAGGFSLGSCLLAGDGPGLGYYPLPLLLQVLALLSPTSLLIRNPLMAGLSSPPWPQGKLCSPGSRLPLLGRGQGSERSLATFSLPSSALHDFKPAAGKGQVTPGGR